MWVCIHGVHMCVQHRLGVDVGAVVSVHEYVRICMSYFSAIRFSIMIRRIWWDILFM